MKRNASQQRLDRIALIEKEAKRVFGLLSKVREWLSRDNAALGGTLISMLETEAGAGEVRKVLSAIAFGGAD